MLMLAVVMALAIWDYYVTAPWTRDGRVRVQVASVAPQVSGRIVEVRTADNQFVRKGDVLYVIDPFDYEVAVQSSRALVEQKAADLQVKQVQSDRRQHLSSIAASAEEQQVFAGTAIQANAAFKSSQQQLARAEVNLQRANRFDDVYLFYDPITYQDNRPSNALSSHSWAIGLTFSLPVFNRNQGNIARAQSNVVQTKLELSSLERRVVSEVRLAERECQRSRDALEQIETAILPRAAATLRRKTEQLAAGKISADDFQGHLDDAAEVTQSHRDAIVRNRRAMLDLNTAVGLRILP